MTYLYSEFFEMLRLAKILHDSTASEKFHEMYDQLELDCDMCYELAYNAMSLVFDFTFEDFNEDYEFSTWVFGDPRIDKFCRLCQEYEEKYGLSEEKNPYRQEIARVIRDGFEFPSYDYNFAWCLSAADRGRKRLLFFTGLEFCALTSVPVGLLDIGDGFDALNQRLEDELRGGGTVLQLPDANERNDRKEAA